MAMKKEPVKKIFVGGLNPDTTKEAIQEYFETYGEVQQMLLLCIWRRTFVLLAAS